METRNNEVKIYKRNDEIWPWGIHVPPFYKSLMAIGCLVCGSYQEAKRTARRIMELIEIK